MFLSELLTLRSAITSCEEINKALMPQHASEAVYDPCKPTSEDLSSTIELRPNDLASPRIGVGLTISPKLDLNPAAPDRGPSTVCKEGYDARYRQVV